jgi:predicted ATPase
MDPQIRRQRTLEAIKRLLLRETRNHPLLIVIEDLHWVDNETQAFLASLAESIAGARLLLLVSYRRSTHTPGERRPTSVSFGSTHWKRKVPRRCSG